MERSETPPEAASEIRPDDAAELCLHPSLSLAEGQLLPTLRTWLPKPPGRVLLAGPATRRYEAPLSEWGYSVTLSESWPEEIKFQGTFEVILLFEALRPGLGLEPKLEVFRSHLEEQGWLILLDLLEFPSQDFDDPEALTTATLGAALAEAGFCPRRRENFSAEALPAVKEVLEACRRLSPERRRELEHLEQGEAVLQALAARKERHRIRTYREGDEAKIIDLFTEAFHHHRGSDHWRWQYLSNPWGSLKLSLAFDEAGRLDAQYAAYPMRFLRSRQGRLETLHGHQVGDTMTRPSARNIGRGPTSLLGRTARHFFARFCEGQVAFNYGFNVGNIQRFSMLILEAQRVAPVRFLQRSLEGSGAAVRFRGVPTWKSLLGGRIEAVGSLDSRWDQFLEEVAASYGFLVCRDQAYLRWRYFERPGFHYHLLAAFEGKRLRGWSVFRREEERLIWGDGLFDPKAIRWVESLLRAALDSPFGEGAQRLEGWFAPQPRWLRRELQRLGFEEAPEPQDLALMLSPFAGDPTAETLAEELFYTLGDSDLF